MPKIKVRLGFTALEVNPKPGLINVLHFMANLIQAANNQGKPDFFDISLSGLDNKHPKRKVTFDESMSAVLGGRTQIKVSRDMHFLAPWHTNKCSLRSLLADYLLKQVTTDQLKVDLKYTDKRQLPRQELVWYWVAQYDYSGVVMAIWRDHPDFLDYCWEWNSKESWVLKPVVSAAVQMAIERGHVSVIKAIILTMTDHIATLTAGGDETIWNRHKQEIEKWKKMIVERIVTPESQITGISAYHIFGLKPAYILFALAINTRRFDLVEELLFVFRYMQSPQELNHLFNDEKYCAPIEKEEKFLKMFAQMNFRPTRLGTQKLKNICEKYYTQPLSQLFLTPLIPTLFPASIADVIKSYFLLEENQAPSAARSLTEQFLLPLKSALTSPGPIKKVKKRLCKSSPTKINNVVVEEIMTRISAQGIFLDEVLKKELIFYLRWYAELSYTIKSPAIYQALVTLCGRQAVDTVFISSHPDQKSIPVLPAFSAITAAPITQSAHVPRGTIERSEQRLGLLSRWE
jgi:hypothetical protein